MRTALSQCSVAVLVILAGACQQRAPAPGPAANTESAAATASKPDARARQQLMPVLAEDAARQGELGKVVALGDVLQEHRGKVVLVDFWATWCRPCRELFPHTAGLQRRLADRGLVVITVSVDDPEDKLTEVREYLKSQPAMTRNFIALEGGGSQAAKDFDLDGGSVPHFQIFDREGVRREKIFGTSANPKDLDRAVEKYL